MYLSGIIKKQKMEIIEFSTNTSKLYCCWSGSPAMWQQGEQAVAGVPAVITAFLTDIPPGLKERLAPG